MAGYTPPASQPRLGFEGQQPLKVPRAGLLIRPGAGIVGRTVEGTLALDAAQISSPEEVSLYVPGILTPGQIGLWSNVRPSGRAVLVGLELNLATAPTAADASNFLAVKVTDSKGASALLAMGSTDKHFMLDRGSGVKIARYRDSGDTGVGYNTDAGADARAMISTFVPSQNMVVTGLEVPLNCTSGRSAGSTDDSDSSGNDIPYVGTVRAVLTDAAGVVLGQATAVQTITRWVYNPPNPATLPGVNKGEARLRFPFPVSTSLKAGQTYYVGIELVDNPPPGRVFSLASGNSPRIAYCVNGTTPGQPITSAGVFRRWGAAGAYSKDAQKPADWTAAVKGTDGWVDGGVDFTWSVLGSGGGLPLVGDVTLSIVQAGTGGMPGAGLNLRALFALGN